jgi:hypothetical protein
VDATATGGDVVCGSSGLVLTVAPSQFAPIAASISVTGKAGYTAASNPDALLGQTCSSRYGPATWASAGGATTLSATATDATCTTGTEGSCQGLATRLTPKGQLAVAARHTCTIRASDGAVLCSGENNVSAGGLACRDGWAHACGGECASLPACCNSACMHTEQPRPGAAHAVTPPHQSHPLPAPPPTLHPSNSGASWAPATPPTPPPL